MKRLALLLVVFLSAAGAHSSAQGSLTPPGFPGPTMKRLDEVEARTIVNATNTPGDAANTFIISAPGSYYLTGNFTGQLDKNGISIQADNVTLDLNGFLMKSGGGTLVKGIDVPTALKNFRVSNGAVSGWTGGGIKVPLATNTYARELRISECSGGAGLYLGSGLATDCVSANNDTGFVLGNGAQVEHSTATSNTLGFQMSDRSVISNCLATINTNGISATNFVTVQDCTISRNTQTGIAVGQGSAINRCNSTRNAIGIRAENGSVISECTASQNGFGITTILGTVRNCVSTLNTDIGIQSSGPSHLVGNTCDQNNQGIYIGTGDQVDGNSCTGNVAAGFRYQVAGSPAPLVIRNVARGNGTNFQFDTAVTGQVIAPTGSFSTTNAWANFSY